MEVAFASCSIGTTGIWLVQNRARRGRQRRKHQTTAAWRHTWCDGRRW